MRAPVKLGAYRGGILIGSKVGCLIIQKHTLMYYVMYCNIFLLLYLINNTRNRISNCLLETLNLIMVVVVVYKFKH